MLVYFVYQHSSLLSKNNFPTINFKLEN